MDDQDDITTLLHNALAGDQDAWDTLVDRFTDALWSWARRAGLSPAAAEDVVQLTWLRLLERGHTIKEAAALPGWLRTTLVREAQRTHHKNPSQSPLDDLDLADSVSLGPEASTVAQDRDRLLWEAVETLPEECQQLLALLTREPPASYKQISAELDMPIGTIGWARRRCLTLLREELGHRGITGL